MVCFASSYRGKDMSENGKSTPRRVGIIGHVGRGGVNLAVAAALAFAGATAAAPAYTNHDRLMDRQRQRHEEMFAPYADGKKGLKKARRDKLYKNPATRWRV
jgi:hypothetical protein